MSFRKLLTNSVVHLVVWTLLGFIHCNAQSADRERMATALEQGNDHRGAARIFIELLHEHPDNARYFQGVVRTLSALSQYESLVPIAEAYSIRHPSIEVEILLGTLASKTNKADDPYWEKALQLGKYTATTYAAVGKAQAELMLSAKAIVSYQQARKIAEDSNAYAEQLFRLFSVAGRQSDAVTEILRLFEITGDEHLAQGRLAAVMTSPEGTSAADQGIAKAAKANPDVLRLQWWFLTQVHRWEEALAIVEKVDENERQGGRIILQFADAARKDQAYDIAIRAYGSLLDRNSTIAVSASYGYTQTLDQRLSQGAALSTSDAKTIIDRYEEIATNHSNHPLAANALLRVAELTARFVKDTDAAINVLTKLINRWRGTSSAYEGSLMLSDLYYIKGNSRASDELLTNIQQSSSTLADIAKLRKADHELYNGNITPARQTYLELSSNTESDAANDAIDRLGILMLVPDDSTGVFSYIHGMKLVALGRLADAASTFSQTAVTARDPDLVDRSHLSAAIVYAEVSDTQAVQQQLAPIINRIPESTVGDRALQIVADLYWHAGKIQEAITTLTTMLVQYPRSILAPAARESIRKMRGDV